ncbi:WYL domain-containing protein [Geosporobacter ferrireducens]|uniref:Uncharacterized protein n=1 Tax=Geosporobacter ferrireducens TaxID=1424294 RepID=A0A1D8GET8_9FIRM|nr:WYL domain-containing protein [Geosporobacter ferrireducens]AOT69417.1 hypothetical protein Gferi_07415 [Geosporobacter ferrireducens]
MDSIYNEIYGLYYWMLEKILKKAMSSELTLKDIHDIVAQYGFSESNLYFTPEVIAQGKQGYNLLKESGAGYASILQSSPAKPLTNLQKSFIKSVLSDKKIHLFFDEDMLKEIHEALWDTAPLFNVDNIAFKETALDRDDYADEKYISNFKCILGAIRDNRALKICFNTSKGERKTMKLAPYKLEYGIRDDKFRICGIRIQEEKENLYVKINLARIVSITVLKQSFLLDYESFIAAKRKTEPIEIEVYNLRKGFERVFIGLSNYERISSFHEESGKCSIKIYYTDDDEQELLILLLSYGPAIKVLGPPDFRTKFIERVQKQFHMFNRP